MDSTESLKNHQSGIFDEFFKTSNEEEIVKEYGMTFVKFLPCTVEIKIDIKMFDEFCDWISVCVRFLLDYFY